MPDERRMTMTRDDVRTLFPDATDDAITKLLNQNNSEVAKEKAKAEKMRSDIQELRNQKGLDEEARKELEQKLEEMEQGSLSAEEKRAKEQQKILEEMEQIRKENADLKKAQFIANQRSEAVTNFKISGEQAKEVVKDDGSFDMVKLGEIMKEKESAAALAKEKEIADMSSNPGGHNSSGSGNSMAKDMAIASAKRAGTANKNILDNYRR
jgi:hypothetical protein